MRHPPHGHEAMSMSTDGALHSLTVCGQSTPQAPQHIRLIPLGISTIPPRKTELENVIDLPRDFSQLTEPKSHAKS